MDLEFFKMRANTMLDYADAKTVEFIYYFLLRRVDWKALNEKLERECSLESD